MKARVTAIHTYPVKDGPGTDLTECRVEEEGLAGDRRKKAPVYLVATEQQTPTTRANLVLDLTAEEISAAIGSAVLIGDTVLGLGGTTGSCSGSYAEVLRPGTVRVGDLVELWTEEPVS
ncbi:MAG: hypothetical protein ABI131_06150 [Nostocoides sp.]